MGVCEIGNQQDLDHLLARLKKAGLDYKHSYLSAGPDPYRRQALLSHYPINRQNVPNYTYKMKGKTHEIRRGILDATVNTPKGNIRFIGAHLKSKRPIAVYDQAEIRREEAQLLRKHTSMVLSDANCKLIVFGDMNDTKGSSTIRLMRGPKEKKLTAIELFDKHGTKWTQYWAKEDIYSRFDFVFVSTSLLPSIDQKGSYVLDTPPGDPASDHRALVILIK
jgi:endonuclease/exonuclease/phosphatase family metal-dependent hydrolase